MLQTRNAWIAFLGTLNLATHMALMVLQMAAILAAAASNTKRTSSYTGQLAMMAAGCLHLFSITLSLDREWRKHYLEQKQQRLLVEQERALVTLLCHEINNPLNVRLPFAFAHNLLLRMPCQEQCALRLHA